MIINPWINIRQSLPPIPRKQREECWYVFLTPTGLPRLGYYNSDQKYWRSDVGRFFPEEMIAWRKFEWDKITGGPK